MTSDVIEVAAKDSKHGAFYSNVPVTCLCGNTFTISTTKPDPINIEACPQCHSAYIKEAKVVSSSGGRLNKFNARLKKSQLLNK
ncbi:MAG: 50S ribosomal protein L31 [Candidatus Absconditabacterales bacterium]|nr:50S ribosomal protein L31 [Candidatus Absconditabacterales bacterium]